MTGLDFETGVRCGIPILAIVLNNRTMAVEIPSMRLSHERYKARDLGGGGMLKLEGPWVVTLRRLSNQVTLRLRSSGPEGRQRRENRHC